MDLKLVFDPVTFTCDLAMDGSDLAVDDGLETALIISLFSDRQANPDDTLPDDDGFMNRGSGDRRGWWGDWYPDAVVAAQIAGIGTLPEPDDRIGSRFWLLSREKQTQAVLQRAQDYDQESLQWMLDDDVAAEVDVTASFPRTGILGRAINITRPDGTSQNYQFDVAWKAMAAGNS